MEAQRRQRRTRPLDAAALDRLALRYDERFATTRSRLAQYLRRKLRERGWDAGAEPDVDALVERLARNGYVDDESYALSKARSLTARGYGAGRVQLALRAAGVGEDDGSAARTLAADEAVDAILRFAKKRRLGPFADAPLDRAAREKALGAAARAGHRLDLARRIIDLAPGTPVGGEVFEEF